MSIGLIYVKLANLQSHCSICSLEDVMSPISEINRRWFCTMSLRIFIVRELCIAEENKSGSISLPNFGIIWLIITSFIHEYS